MLPVCGSEGLVTAPARHLDLGIDQRCLPNLRMLHPSRARCFYSRMESYIGANSTERWSADCMRVDCSRPDPQHRRRHSAPVAPFLPDRALYMARCSSLLVPVPDDSYPLTGVLDCSVPPRFRAAMCLTSALPMPVRHSPGWNGGPLHCLIRQWLSCVPQHVIEEAERWALLSRFRGLRNGWRGWVRGHRTTWK